MASWVEYESGLAWCESAYKYQTLPQVAEFANTITNLPLIVLPLLNAFMLKDYIVEVNPIILVPHLILALNGCASTYYHATLNLLGQLLDEVALVWLISAGLFSFMPTMAFVNKLPLTFRQHLNAIRWAMAAVTLFVSGLCFLQPALNSIMLMTVSIPLAYLIYTEGSGAEEFPQVSLFTWRIFRLWVVAMLCWGADKALCDLWIYLRLPYLHAAFHCFSALSAYNCFVAFSYLDVERRAQQHQHSFTAKIRFFPPWASAISFPYISIKQTKQQ